MIKIHLRLILSQFKIFFREPGVVFWSFGFPLLMAWILGIAFAYKGDALHIVQLLMKVRKRGTVFRNGCLKKPELIQRSIVLSQD